MIRYPVIAVLSLLAGCSMRDANRDWDAFRDRFIEGALRDDPGFAVSAGRHEFDGRLPDWSEAGLARTIARLRAARDTAVHVAPASLDSTRRFEREYLIAITDGQLFWVERADLPHRNPEYYLGNLSPDVYLRRAYAPLADRMRAYVAWARAVPAATAQVRDNLRPPLARPIIDIGRLRFAGLSSYLTSDVPAVFATVQDTALQREFQEANAAAARAFAEMDAWLEAQRPTQTEDFALGAERFAEMLQATERVELPLDRLQQIGREDMARNVAALAEACAAFRPGATIPACTQAVRAHKPPGGAVAEASRQLGGLEAFVRQKDLVSIPGAERAEVRESPPYRRANTAYIDIPGPYETGQPSIYYIAPPDPTWSKEEQAAYIPGETDLLFISVHEVWPGHFLQFLHANRAPSMLGRLFVGYAYAEGWAHYSEELMWEAGLGNGDPETHIGQLQNALLRDARFLSAIGLQSGTMTTAESERLFREEAFQDPGTARQQAARGTYDPAYLNYTLGKLMIRRLREDWTASRGGRAAWKAFHDTFLGFGGPPIPQVRNAMLGDSAGPAL